MNPWNLIAAVQSYVVQQQVEATIKQSIRVEELKGEAAYRLKRLTLLEEEQNRLREESRKLPF